MTKIVSWNVNSLKVRQEQVIDYLEEHNPDILGLQELKQTDDAIDIAAFTQKNWHFISHGQKTYNGVALISRHPPENIVRGIPNYDDTQARAICASYGNIRVLNLYVPNGKAIGDEKYHYKLTWLEKLYEYVKTLLQQYPALVIIGDFNIAPNDIDVHDPQKWQNKILCSDAERQALNQLLALGFQDAYRIQHPDKQQFSWWDYRMGGFKRNIGLRIDLTLTSPPLRIDDADIDIAPRQLERPSDHAPAWVAVSLV